MLRKTMGVFICLFMSKIAFQMTHHTFNGTSIKLASVNEVLKISCKIDQILFSNMIFASIKHSIEESL